MTEFKYTSGFCDAMALALHRMTGLPVALWRGRYYDDWNDEYAFEVAHAVVILDRDAQRYADVRGIQEGPSPDLQFNEPVDRIELVEAGVEDVRYAFTCEGVSHEDIQEAARFAREHPPLAYFIAVYGKYLNEPETGWQDGGCCVFANALRERFDLPLAALLVRERDGFESLLHAFVRLPDGRVADSAGVRDEAELVATYRARGDEALRAVTLAKGDIELVVREITLDELDELNPETLCATQGAHDFIKAQFKRFTALDQSAATQTRRLCR